MAQLEHEVEGKPRKKSFFNLDKIFLKMSEVSVKQEDPAIVTKTSEQLALEKMQNEQIDQANKFLNAQLYEFYFAMIKNGYQPIEAQEKRMNNKVNEIIRHSSNYVAELNTYIKAGFQLNMSVVYSLVLHDDFSAKFFSSELFNINAKFPSKNMTIQLTEKEIALNKSIMITGSYYEPFNIAGEPTSIKTDLFHKNNEFFQEFRKVLFSDKFADFMGAKMKTFFKDFINEHQAHDSISIMNSKIAKKLTPILKFLPHIAFKNVPVNDFVHFVSEHNNLFGDEHLQTGILVKDNKQRFHTILNTHYAPAMTQLLNKTKEVYTNSYFQQKAIQNIYTLAQDYNVQNLPQNTQFLITDIQKNYGILQKHVETLSEDQLFNIENLFDKRVPEVLQKYFSIDQEYRESLTNSEGKNALQLMDESLINFNSKFKDIIEDINENKLSDLSATKRYSKTI